MWKLRIISKGNYTFANTRNITRKETNTERKQKRRNHDNTFDSICLGFFFCQLDINESCFLKWEPQLQKCPRHAGRAS